jgi:hypothetical protein
MATNDALNIGASPPLSIARGGTNLTTYDSGDILYASAPNTLDQLAIGTVGQVFQPVNSNVVWAIPAKAGVSNLGVNYTGTTLTIRSASGAALSATNPGYVTLPSITSGNLITIAVTANQTLTGGGAGTTNTLLLGLVNGIAWSGLPIYLYAVLNDAESAISFGISRNPSAKTSPAATSISKSGTILNVDQYDFFLMGNPTIADYAQNPCVCIGSTRADFNAAHNWTWQTFSAYDGIGKFNDYTFFSMPISVNGSATGTYFQSNAGTEPTFTSQACVYRVSQDGTIMYRFVGPTINNTPAGANVLQLTLPYAAAAGVQGIVGYYYDSSATAKYKTLSNLTAGNRYLDSIMCPTASGTLLTNASFATNDSFYLITTYSI